MRASKDFNTSDSSKAKHKAKLQNDIVYIISFMYNNQIYSSLNLLILYKE